MFEYIELKKQIRRLTQERNEFENKFEALKDKRIDIMIELLSKDDTCKRQAQKILQLEAIIKTQKEIIEGFMYEKRVKRKRKTTVQK